MQHGDSVLHFAELDYEMQFEFNIHNLSDNRGPNGPLSSATACGTQNTAFELVHSKMLTLSTNGYNHHDMHN